MKPPVLRLVVITLALLGWSLPARAAGPHIVFVVGDHEYGSEGTMPALAKELEKRYRFKTTVLLAQPDQNAEENIPGLEALARADLAVFYLRWRRLPEDQLKHLENYYQTGRPIVGFRTSTHAFNYPKTHPLVKWNAFFGSEFLGAPPGWGADGHTHYGHDSTTDVYLAPGASKHPVLKGVEPEFHVRSWLYHVLPKWPPADATVLLMGRAVNPNKPAPDNPVAWTWRNRQGARVFTTTMGHPEDFQVPAFQRLVVNAVHWAAGLNAPDQWPGNLDINVPYRGMVRTGDAKKPEPKKKK
jgi:type 1 glutamine amidotransferase